MNSASLPRSLVLASVSALALSALSGCGSQDGDAGSSGSSGVSVVATTTPLGSVTDEIAQCAGGTSSTLMGPGDDPHDFSASSQQVVQMAKADVVVANGLGLEQGLESAIDSARSDGATVLEVGPEVNPLPFGEADEHGEHEEEHAEHEEGHEEGHEEHADEHTEHEEGHEEGHDHEHGSEDPHFWLDTGRMATAATVIGDEVARQSGDEEWSRCGEQVSAELSKTDKEVRDILSAVPQQGRVLVTDHDAFGYFAKAYDFRVAGVVIPGGSTDAEPSSSEVADLVEVVREEKVPALFSNTAVSGALVDAVAAEVGRDVQVVPLYVGSVGPADGPASDYQGMVLTNARAIADALA